MKASSMERGSTSGVSWNIIVRTSPPTAAYFFMPGLTTVASGQRLGAWNIDMAECTPYPRGVGALHPTVCNGKIAENSGHNSTPSGVLALKAEAVTVRRCREQTRRELLRGL